MLFRSSQHRAYPVQRSGLHLPFVHSAATPYVRRCVRTVGSVMYHHSRSSPPLPQRSSLRSGFFCPSPSTLRTTSSVPLGGTSRFRRLAAYTECLRCAGAPRRPPSGSELSLMLFHNMSSSETTGTSSAALTQYFTENSGLQLGIKVSAFPSYLTLRFWCGVRFRGLTTVRFRYDLLFCLPSCRS
jgi:hypothetical protein